MKFQKTTLALLALSAFAGVAHAQSSVTLYGIADAGILYNNNNGGHSQVSLSTANSSRFGLKGTEDLGGGLSAIFTLENGYAISSGGLSQGAVSVGNNAQGLYLLAWDMLQHHLEFFRYRPREFIMAAARYTRFRLHLKHSGVPTAVQAYKLTNPVAKFMVAAMWPLGYAMYRRDRRRGVA